VEPERVAMMNNALSSLRAHPYPQSQKESQKTVDCTLIREVIIPLVAPTHEIITLIESAQCFMHDKKLNQCMHAIDEAREKWLNHKEASNVKELELYFSLAKCQAYEAGGRDDLSFGE